MYKLTMNLCTQGRCPNKPSNSNRSHYKQYSTTKQNDVPSIFIQSDIKVPSANDFTPPVTNTFTLNSYKHSNFTYPYITTLEKHLKNGNGFET